MYKKLKETREKLGRTQEDMAKLIGCKTKNAYSMKERGERKFSIDEARTIADDFQMEIKELFFNK